MNYQKIVACEIVEARCQNTVMVQLEDGTLKDVFDYFWDEISFRAEEFVGLTEDEAHDLFHQRDVAYLRS
jgi:hypothetical protein